MINGDKILEASQILSTLLKKKQILESDDKYFYNLYVFNEDVQVALDNMLEGLGFSLYRYRDGLYLSVKKDNNVFGFDNEELRYEFGVGNNNLLYLCYFIMYTVITSFYYESSTNTPVAFLNNTTLMERVSLKLNALASDKDGAEAEDVGFYYMNKLWISFDDVSVKAAEEDVHKKLNTTTKIGLVNKVLNFMKTQGLLRESIEEKTYEPTLRFRAIIANYYDEKDNRNDLNSLIND